MTMAEAANPSFSWLFSGPSMEYFNADKKVRLKK